MSFTFTLLLSNRSNRQTYSQEVHCFVESFRFDSRYNCIRWLNFCWRLGWWVELTGLVGNHLLDCLMGDDNCKGYSGVWHHRIVDIHIVLRGRTMATHQNSAGWTMPLIVPSLAIIYSFLISYFLLPYCIDSLVRNLGRTPTGGQFFP